jgi:tRNA G18 (ribose-2'-O)-methylase SpoU
LISTVADPTDPRLADYARLTDIGHRVRREPGAGVFIAEGPITLRRTLAAGFTPRSLLLAPNRVEPVADLVAAVTALGAPVYVAPPGALSDLTGYQVHRGLLAAMNRRPLPEPAALLAGARRVAVLENVVDHTNCGAAFRSAAAFGVDAVLVTPSCADPLYRRAVRTSMGAVFTVPWTRLSTWPGELATLHAAGFVTAALTPDPTAIDLREFAADPPDRLALVLGTEGDGLRPETLAATTVRVCIPMAGGLDSLNVAAAAAVAFYATVAGKE